jgi:hypothetical protein
MLILIKIEKTNPNQENPKLNHLKLESLLKNQAMNIKKANMVMADATTMTLKWLNPTKIWLKAKIFLIA